MHSKEFFIYFKEETKKQVYILLCFLAKQQLPITGRGLEKQEVHGEEHLLDDSFLSSCRVLL